MYFAIFAWHIIIALLACGLLNLGFSRWLKYGIFGHQTAWLFGHDFFFLYHILHVCSLSFLFGFVAYLSGCSYCKLNWQFQHIIDYISTLNHRLFDMSEKDKDLTVLFAVKSSWRSIPRVSNSWVGSPQHQTHQAAHWTHLGRIQKSWQP